MQRRTLLGLGMAAAAVVSLVGAGAAWLHDPAWRDGRLLRSGREVLRAVANAVLDGSLPDATEERSAALDNHLQRMETTIAALPVHMQEELGTLLAVLASAPLRRIVVGLAAPWDVAPISEAQRALQSMRTSSSMLRRQAYGALRDLTHAAYFVEPSTWVLLHYPGPRALA